MGVGITFAFIVPLIVLFALAIPIIVCIYIYKDATRRNTNPLLWVILALVLPFPIGLIIYLVLRDQSFVSTRCKTCGASVKKNYRVCPECGSTLKSGCPNCGCDIEPGWVACPQCGTNVSGYSGNGTDGGKGFDKSLRNVIIAAVSIFVALIIAVITLVSVFVVRRIDRYENIYNEPEAYTQIVPDDFYQY